VSPRALRGVMAAAAVLLLVYGGGSLVRVWQMQREVETLERDIASLRDETQRLSRTIDGLRNNPDEIERLARETLGLVKPGERILKLPPSTPGG
jgi:cell division protein FtsB